VAARAIALASALVAALYLVQLPGPLRLDNDSAIYLRLASSFADGHGLHPAGIASFPPGLPALLGGLERAGLGEAWAFTFLNVCFLALGLVCAGVALRLGLGLSRNAAAIVCLLTAVSALAVKNTMLPLSEIPFFGLANASVAALAAGRARRAIRLVVIGVVLAVLACSVRTAGIALLPAVVLAFPERRSRVAAGVTTAIAAVVAVTISPRYLDEFRDGWNGSPLADLLAELRDLARDVGAAVSNVPVSRVDEFEWILVSVGALAVLLAGITLWRRRDALGPVDGWLLGCFAVVFAWPADHPRFVLPVLPVLLGACYLALRPRVLTRAWVLFLAVTGTAALVYSVSLAYAGDSFPERYADGVLAPSYRVAWREPHVGDAKLADPALVALLRRYDASHGRR
jgi:hypothetical protein